MPREGLVRAWYRPDGLPLGCLALWFARGHPVLAEPKSARGSTLFGSLLALALWTSSLRDTPGPLRGRGV